MGYISSLYKNGKRVEVTMKLKLSKPKVEKIGETHTKVSCSFSIGPERTVNLWYQAPNDIIDPNVASDAFFCAVLIPSMKIAAQQKNVSLSVAEPVSPMLLKQSEDVQAVINSWYPKFHKLPINAKERERLVTPSAPAEKASFFSGGIDSFYTMLKHNDEYRKIFYVHGFDLFLDMKEQLDDISQRLKRAAKDFDKELVEVATNIHDFSEEFAYWPDHYHGSAMASMALMFSKQVDTFYFASTHSYADLFPWGSHPVLDPLWSTEYLTIRHDGAEVNRVQKTEYIVNKDRRVLNYLNVGCKEKCERKEKCLRTMIALDTLGVLTEATTFYHDLHLEDVRNIYINDANAFSFVLENFFALSNREDKIEMRRALRVPIEDYKNRVIANKLNGNVRSFLQSRHSEKFKDELKENLESSNKPAKGMDKIKAKMKASQKR